jgi:hypothetical protein
MTIREYDYPTDDCIKSTTVRDRVIRHITAESNNRVDSGISGCSTQVPAWRLNGDAESIDVVVREQGARMTWEDFDEMVAHANAIRARADVSITITGKRVTV